MDLGFTWNRIGITILLQTSLNNNLITNCRADDWGGEVGKNCYQETQPIVNRDYWGSGSDRKMMRVVESVITDLETRGVTVKLLNITQLSEYRKEAHLSVYRKNSNLAIKEEMWDPLKCADCFHWCLPGVQDVWNELLYAYIFEDRMTKLSWSFRVLL